MSDLGMNLITNDLDIVNGEIYLVTGDDAIAQDLQQSMQLWLGTGYGVTVNGFVMPQQTDLQTAINQSLQAQLGADINTNPETLLGQFSGIISSELSLVWQAMQDVYNSQIPDTAFGASLDNVGALRGIPRLQATDSVIENVKLFGAAGTAVAAGTQFSVSGSPGNIFALNSAITLLAGASCIQTILFSTLPVSGTWVLTINGSATSNLAYNVSASTLQSAIQALNFCSGCTVTGSVSAGFTVSFNGAGTGGLMVQPQFSATSSLVNSSSASVSIATAITQAGVDQASVTVTATATGPIIANAGTLTNIVTPVSGLTNVLNIQDEILGSNVETDSAYRARMNEELQIAGAGTVEAIRARLLATTGVTSALVYENVEDVNDSNGRPPHCFECVVNGGSNADVAETIWLAKPAGILTYGSSNYTITDSQGQTHVINFSRPSIINVYLIVNLEVNLTFPSNGATLVQELLANYINALGQGVSVVVEPYLAAQLASIPGIDYATILIGTAPDPTESNNIAIVAYQQAATQTDYITVNVTSG
ncbi:unnamed protein product [Sphagnum balticum]